MCTNIQRMDKDDKQDIAQVMIAELEHVLSLVGPAKEEIAQLQEHIVGRQVPPGNTVLEDNEGLKHQLENVKEENTKLHQQLRRLETKQGGMPDKLQKEMKKIRELETSIKTLEEEKIQKEKTHKEAKMAFMEVNRDVENRLQSALKKLEEMESLQQQRQLYFEKEIRKMQQEKAKVSATLKQEKTEKATLEKDLSETKSRLSKLMGDKLSDNNPDIADLSDNNRPTKLAEKYQELYDNQWTDAYEIAEKCFPTKSEETRIKVLLQILMKVYTFCKDEYAQQDRDFLQAMYRTDKTDEPSFACPAALKTQLKDLKCYSVANGIGNITQKYLKNCDKTTHFGKFNEQVEAFVFECVTLCWLMVHQDPPLVFHRNVQKGDMFDSNMYKHYTATGTIIGYVVWPALLLHEDGPVLSKGILQCVKSLHGSQSVRVRSQKVNVSEQGIPTTSVRLTGTDSNTGHKKTAVNVDDRTITELLQKLKVKESSPDSRTTSSGNPETFDQECTNIQDDKTMSTPGQQPKEKSAEENFKQPNQQQQKQSAHLDSIQQNQTSHYSNQFRSEAHVQITRNQYEGVSTQHPHNDFHAFSENNKFPPNQPTDNNHGQNQSTLGSFQQNQPIASNFQQNQATDTNYQQSCASNFQQNYSTAGSFQESHQGATNFQQSQQSARNFQPNQSTSVNIKQNQATDNSFHQNQSTAGNSKQNRPSYLQMNQFAIGNSQQNSSICGSGISNHNVTFSQSQSTTNQPYSTQNSQVSSTGNQQFNQEQFTSYGTYPPAYLIPSTEEYNIFFHWNSYFGNIEQARQHMGAQLYDKCMNYYRWLNARQYN